MSEDLARIADPDLHASLATSPRPRPDDDPYRPSPRRVWGNRRPTGSRFRILRPHAKGGLGQVSVALDQELDRPVALKEIQDRHADEPHSRARFVQEAEITGKLEHPGIIPVYGLGHDATGRPFYAMRFIKGDSLKEAIAAFHGDEGLKKDPAARMSRLRELLRRFTDVCNAIAYAHSRGVLHRDLKPGNIMLGPYSETLVVDWGLAKSVGDALSGRRRRAMARRSMEGPIRLSGLSGSGAETVAGSPIGTPAFASPEQLTGATDRLGPATDIYGLGATLYALLTGRPPVESNDLGEVIRRVERGEIPPPRSIDPTIPRPLEAICRKAMATDPADRYVSARALATDVTRWLDDEPVSADREPFSERAASVDAPPPRGTRLDLHPLADPPAGLGRRRLDPRGIPHGSAPPDGRWAPLPRRPSASIERAPIKPARARRMPGPGSRGPPQREAKGGAPPSPGPRKLMSPTASSSLTTATQSARSPGSRMPTGPSWATAKARTCSASV